uniref:Putative secreted protein n=1 Tax=Ixodes ricinus TaxID=34613 RepID=A0A090X815_IXORI
MKYNWCAALALTVIVAALLARSSPADFEGQQPVRPPGFFPRPPGNAGDGCKRSLQMWKCHMLFTIKKTGGYTKLAKLLGQHGELCSESGAKGDIFHQHLSVPTRSAMPAISKWHTYMCVRKVIFLPSSTYPAHA